MAAGKLIWVGVACCLGGLLINLFPALAYAIGMEPRGAWQVFAFGLFLIILAAVLGGGAGRESRKPD
jgi:hypothetical protein